MKLITVTEDQITDLCALWNKELGLLFPVRERILRQNIIEDPNFFIEGSWTAIDEASGAIVGTIVSKIWQDAENTVEQNGEQGWIHVLLVDSDFHNEGIGSELLNKAESALKSKGVRQEL
jgi:GNAT superfamily N-acetyltransferase